MIYTKQKQLDKALKKWQKVLRLQDWIIKAHIVRTHEMVLPKKEATVSWSLPAKTATIQILDGADYHESFEDQDHELALVHELLHLHYSGFDTTESGSLAEMMVEQSIEAISRALVALNRKERGVKP